MQVVVNGEARQIDASFALGDRLVVAKCRAVSKSVAFKRGDPKATEFRRRKLLKAFHDVDEKAHWLADHPMGRNYNASTYREILPLVVSPFVEFAPAPTNAYRISDTLSRVTTPR